MSLALIEESAKEARRLAVAGSSLAVGDFRLKKLAAPLEQAGAKVPVFAQVAKSINDLVGGTEADSAARLLNLSTLLNAILYTQGQSSVEGDCRELEVFTTNCVTTKTSARVLKPLVQALTSSGGGRLEIIQSTAERGAFNDLRLIGPAIDALGDNYPEIADFVAEKILPAYGSGIAPRLTATLDLKGKKSDARKLKVLHALDPASTLPLCKAALDDGSPEVKIAAIECLGQDEANVPLLLEQSNSKNKSVRAAALEALAPHDRPEIVKLFSELLKGKALDLLARPFRALRNKNVLKSLLDEGNRVLELLIKGDSEQILRFWEILDCLEHRKESEPEEFLLGCFDNIAKLAKLKPAKNSVVGGNELVTRLSVALYNAGTPKSLDKVLAKRDVLPTAAFGQVLRSALRRWPAEKVFTEFSPLLNEKRGAGKEKSSEIYRTICATGNGGIGAFIGSHDYTVETEEPSLIKIEWDSRWVDAAIKADEFMMACWLARPNHKGIVDYLLKQLEAKGQENTALIIEALARCQYPKLTDRFIELVKIKTKGADRNDWDVQQLFGSARFLQRSDLPRLDALATTLDEKLVDDFLAALEPLRTTPPTSI